MTDRNITSQTGTGTPTSLCAPRSDLSSTPADFGLGTSDAALASEIDAEEYLAWAL